LREAPKGETIRRTRDERTSGDRRELHGEGREAMTPLPLILALLVGGPAEDTTLWRVTAYCPCKVCCGPKAKGVTASGKRVAPGMVAADKSIPFGTKLRIDGLGTFTVEDRGGAIKGRRLDVYFRTHAEARRFGVRWLRVTGTGRSDQ
jgi:3D (Asp-Asp-Asp) domain-containing protein